MPDSPNAAPVAPGLVARVSQGLRYIVSSVGPNDWFGPAQPIAPMAQEQALGRVLDYRVGYNLSLRPREDEAIGFHQLRALADACGILRLVIETRKDQMERLTWAIQPRLRAHARPVYNDPRRASIETFLRRPDGHNGWATWLRQIVEELLVTDAVALYRRRNAAGQLYGLQQIDGATIKRVIDEYGLTPQAPDPAYQQILHGLPAVDYTADQLLYLPRNKRIHKLYGFSPVEQVVMIVNIALRRQVAQLNYFTEGNIPEALISCPVDWRPNQIREMQEIFDDMLRGDLAQRSGAKFVPGGLNVQFTKDALLKDEFDEWLARIICYAFSVPPTPFIKQSNRATADNASDSAMAEGLAPLQNWVKGLIDRVLAEDFAAPDLEFTWNEDRTLSPQEAMSVNTGYVAAGIKTVAEVRAELGVAPLSGGDKASVTNKTWHFDPDQPRDYHGRWASRDDVDATNISSNSSQASQPVNFQKFFDTYLPYVDPMAQQLDTDPDFFLSLIAKEDTWGTDQHNVALHNYFGVTYAGHNNQGYNSSESARQYWINHFGNAVKGSQTIDQFIAGLKQKSYNVIDSNYYSDLENTYYSVLRHRLQLGIAQ